MFVCAYIDNKIIILFFIKNFFIKILISSGCLKTKVIYIFLINIQIKNEYM